MRKKQDWSPREEEAVIRRLAEAYHTVIRIAVDHGIGEVTYDRISDDFDRIVRRLGINMNGYWRAVSDLAFWDPVSEE